MDLNKKRKLQAELLDLPLPKHKCWGRSFSSPIVCPVDEDLHGEILDDESELDSATDSNRFAGDSNSVISVNVEAKSEPEYEKACPYNHRYSSSAHWGGNSSRDNLYSLKSSAMMKPDVSKDKLTFVAREHNAQLSQNLEEQLLEFENNFDFMFSGYGDETIQHSTDKEPEDMPYSNGLKPNNYVLSSGRWSVNQGTLYMTWNTYAQRGELINTLQLD